MKRFTLQSLLLIPIALILLRCNRTELLKPTTTYIIDSIQIELLQSPNIYNVTTIVNNGDDWQLSFPSSWLPIGLSSYYPTRSVSSDTVQYRQIAYRDNDSINPWFNFLLVKLKNHHLLSTSYNSNLIGGLGQDGVDYDNAIYQYDADRLTYVKTLHGICQGPGYDDGGNTFFYYYEDSIRFNYNGNALQNAFYKSYYHDGSRIQNDEYSAIFSYPSNWQNQKNMIGIDVNDFILEVALRLPLKLPIYRFPIGTTVITSPLSNEILNGISYNTNSDKLIEEIHLHIKTGGVLNQFEEKDTIIKPMYIFDSLHNNRITEITYGTATLNNLISYLHCKFYYRPD